MRNSFLAFIAIIGLFLGILDLLFGSGLIGAIVFLIVIISIGGEGFLKNRIRPDVQEMMRNREKKTLEDF